MNRTDIRDAWLHEFLLRPGELLTFNQRRMLHGRRAFQAYRTGLPQRHLKGCYLNVDDFLSKYRVLRYCAGLSERGTDDTNHFGCRSL